MRVLVKDSDGAAIFAAAQWYSPDKANAKYDWVCRLSIDPLGALTTLLATALLGICSPLRKFWCHVRFQNLLRV